MRKSKFRVDVESFPEARDVRKRWKAAGLDPDRLDVNRVLRPTVQASGEPDPASFIAVPLTDGGRAMGPHTASRGYLRDAEAFVSLSLPLETPGFMRSVEITAEDGRRATVDLPDPIPVTGAAGTYYSGLVYVREWEK